MMSNAETPINFHLKQWYTVLHTNQNLWSVYRHLAKNASSFDILYAQKTKAHTFVHNCKWICKYKWWFYFVNIYTYCIYIYIFGMVTIYVVSISMDSASDILVFVTMHINRLVFWKNNKNKTFLQPRNALSPVFLFCSLCTQLTEQSSGTQHPTSWPEVLGNHG